jgi:hypothetical protein
MHMKCAPQDLYIRAMWFYKTGTYGSKVSLESSVDVSTCWSDSISEQGLGIEVRVGYSGGGLATIYINMCACVCMYPGLVCQ